MHGQLSSQGGQEAIQTRPSPSSSHSASGGNQGAEMGSDPKMHSLDEIAKHNLKNDCWLIISGKVYDVTKFLDDHPGGDEVVLSATEKDATEEFEDVGHSDSAKEMLEKYYIGEFDSSTLPAKDKHIPAPEAAAKFNESSGIGIKLLQFLLPLLLLGIAFVFQYLKKD